MKKNTKLLVISAVIVALLGIALAVVLLIPSNNDEITLSDKNEILLFDKSSLIPEDITVSNKGGNYQLLAFDIGESSKRASSAAASDASTDSQSEEEEEEEITLIYTMQDHPELLLDKQVTDDLVKQCRSQYATEIVDKSGNRYKEYGLEPPVATVSIRYSDGSAEELSLGNEAPGGQGVYMKTSESKNVYLVQSSLTNTFYIEKLQLFDKQVTPEIEDITMFRLSGENYAEELEFRKNGYSFYDGYHVTTAPARYPCDTENTDMLTNALSSLKAVWVADINVDKNDLARFGLDKPYEKIEISADGGTSFTLIASAPDEENIFYLMNTADTKVYRTYASENIWYGMKKTDILYPGILSPDRDEIEKATIIAGGKTYEFTYVREKKLSSNYYETDKITAYLNGEMINPSNLALYLLNVSAIEWTDTPAENTEGMTEVLSIEFKYFNEEEIKDKLVLLRDKSGKTAAVLNGRAECYVDSAVVNKLISQADKITSDESLPSLTGNGDEVSAQSDGETTAQAS